MQKVILSILLACVGLSAQSRTWQPDSLAGYENSTITRSDSQPCTVIRKLSNCNNSKAVLYIHGYNDYFFQKEMGDRFVDSCYNFYAVDLHRYGRSIRKGITPYQAKKIDEYYEDIDSVLAIMKADGITSIALLGHSTGGLIAASYMNASPDSTINVLMLNSPFLQWNMGGFMRKVAVPGVSGIGKLFPNIAISQGDDTSYGESLLKAYHGEWNYNVEWKTLHPRKVTSGWIRMISQAQKKLRKNSNIAVPILLMHSAISVTGSKWTELHQKGDAVLNVDDISTIGNTLGNDVTEVSVYGGLHDLVLSSPKVREKVYNSIFEWLQRYLQPER
jgi:alpha-beta hydrolase superfamily lysophospholipase